MLSRAQEFLNIVLVTLILVSSLELAKNCQVLIDKQKSIVKQNFVNIFFNKEIKTKDHEDFVKEFNEEVLKLHIICKKNDLFVPLSPLGFEKTNKCFCCGESEFIDCDGSLQCKSCAMIIRNKGAIAWSDITRVHTAPVYTYDKKVQFKDFLLQYQGKCSSVDLRLLDNLSIYPKMTRIDFFQTLKSKTKVRATLDQVHLLYYKAFSLKAPDLTLVENLLLEDFDKFVKVCGNEPLLVSNQFLLYQFLNRYGYKTKKDDVLLVDTLDSLPDKACRKVFQKLKWEIFS